MKQTLILILVLVMAISVFASCAKPAEETMPEKDETTTEATEEPQVHAFIFKNTGNPYGEKQMAGFKEAIEEAGHTAILKAPENPTVEDQIVIINELVGQGVDSISITGNDFDALQPALQAAMDAGIKVLSADSAVNPDSRMTHINQADPELIGRVQIQAAVEMIGGSGQIAVLSATSQASNQNLWIEWMKTELEEGDYADVELVEVVNGEDLRDKSVAETEALLQKYPDLKCIIAPTTVGIAAAGKVITDKGLVGEVMVTGLGLPSEMAEYIENGACPWMYLWNPLDVGYLSGYTAMALVDGTITGAVGDTYSAGKLGDYAVIADGDGTQVMLGAPFKFEPSNIEEWKTVY